MAMHPSAAFTVPTLLAELEARAANGVVRVHADGPLRLFCYTQRCVYDRQWDTVAEMARGLVVDVERQAIVARPFPKFFTYGERSVTLPDEPFAVQEKVDGSLIIVFHDGYRWRFVTKGCFGATQAAWAEAKLGRKVERLTPGTTYLFEAVYHANHIVVRYAGEELVLLGGYDCNGNELSDDELFEASAVVAGRRAKEFPFDSIAAAIEHAQALDTSAEGFVVRFKSGFRVKIKGAEYLRVHRLLSRVTPLGVWEAMANGDDLSVIRAGLPEEYWADFDAIHRILEGQQLGLMDAIHNERDRLAERTDKDVGLALQTLPASVRPFIFAARKGALMSNPKARASLFRAIRPDGNHLEGYSPGAEMARLAEELLA